MPKVRVLTVFVTAFLGSLEQIVQLTPICVLWNVMDMVKVLLDHASVSVAGWEATVIYLLSHVKIRCVVDMASALMDGVFVLWDFVALTALKKFVMCSVFTDIAHCSGVCVMLVGKVSHAICCSVISDAQFMELVITVPANVILAGMDATVPLMAVHCHVMLMEHVGGSQHRSGAVHVMKVGLGQHAMSQSKLFVKEMRMMTMMVPRTVWILTVA
jgi:hypothetical protein